MLLIPVRVGPSTIEGNGLLAACDLPAGTPVWCFRPGFDQAFAPADFDALPAIAQAHVRHFAWMRQDDAHWILSGDLACFMNHATSPNTGVPPGSPDPNLTVTMRPVAAGEELTCDYFAFDAQAHAKLGSSPTLSP